MKEIIETIYVQLLGEHVDVWRPVKAMKIEERKFQIIEQLYDQEIEK